MRTTSDLAKYYVDRMIFNKRTARNYLSFSARFDELMGGPSMQNIDEDLLLKWRALVLETASLTSYNTYLRHLKVLYKFAFKRELVCVNPFAEFAYAPKVRRNPKSLTKNQLNEIFACISSRTDGWFWEICLRFLLHTGIRLRQLVTVEWQHVSVEDRRFKVHFEGSKNYREWNIPLTRSVCNDLEMLKARLEAEYHQITHSSQVFNITLWNREFSGNQMTVEQCQVIFKWLSKKLGFRVSAHRFRHTFGTTLGNLEDANIHALQECLGHTDIRTTKIYIASNIKPMRRLVERGFG